MEKNSTRILGYNTCFFSSVAVHDLHELGVNVHSRSTCSNNTVGCVSIERTRDCGIILQEAYPLAWERNSAGHAGADAYLAGGVSLALCRRYYRTAWWVCWHVPCYVLVCPLCLTLCNSQWLMYFRRLLLLTGRGGVRAWRVKPVLGITYV